MKIDEHTQEIQQQTVMIVTTDAIDLNDDDNPIDDWQEVESKDSTVYDDRQLHEDGSSGGKTDLHGWVKFIEGLY